MEGRLTIKKLDHAATGNSSVHLRVQLLQYHFSRATKMLSPCISASMKNAANAIQLPGKDISPPLRSTCTEHILYKPIELTGMATGDALKLHLR